jgi:hypothetical protein
LRKLLLQERGEECEWCGGKKRIEMHHLKPFRFSKEGERENVVLLCSKCHGAADSIFLEMAGTFFASAGYPGLDDSVSILRSKMHTASTRAAS